MNIKALFQTTQPPASTPAVNYISPVQQQEYSLSTPPHQLFNTIMPSSYSQVGYYAKKEDPIKSDNDPPDHNIEEFVLKVGDAKVVLKNAPIELIQTITQILTKGPDVETTTDTDV